MELYRVRDACIERDTSGLPPSGLAPREVKPAHFTVEVCPLNAQDPGRFGDAAVVVLQHRGDVVAFEPGASLPERRVDAGRADGPFELGVRQNILQPELWIREPGGTCLIIRVNVMASPAQLAV